MINNQGSQINACSIFLDFSPNLNYFYGINNCFIRVKQRQSSDHLDKVVVIPFVFLVLSPIQKTYQQAHP